MIFVSHPTGNANVRAVLKALEDNQSLAVFHTTIGVSSGSSLAKLFPAQVVRRAYALPGARLHLHPFREGLRLLASKMGWSGLTRHEVGWASVDAVCRALDRATAQKLVKSAPSLRAVYCYEDCALETFRTAGQLGIRRVYDLPISYFLIAQSLLHEEAERLPAWEPTLGGTRDSRQKLDRKQAELDLAEVVICPSRFVLNSLPSEARATKHCVVAEFGSPAAQPPHLPQDVSRPLRVLFAGSMTQRKGLADVFSALKLLNRSDVELVVMGSLAAPMEFYRTEYPTFRYEAPRAHYQVLELMRSCDVLVLPSIVEGRALVQQEALSCGLPIIVTANAGGEDLIEEGRTGFRVPIRSPEVIAEKISWFADHRDALPQMAFWAQEKAGTLTWAAYGKKVVEAVQFHEPDPARSA